MELSWGRWWAASVRWRRGRPFWGGVVTLAGGLIILLLPANQFTVLALPGVAGLAGFLLGGLIAAMGPLLWFLPEQRVMLGIAIVLLALASFVYSNLGGFLIGMLLSIIGGSLGFAWTPSATKRPTPPHPRPSPTPRPRS
ncbi:hypothetical protein SAMN05216266_1425 [Amycolatopsis marina]|uniref:Uncharacterized protein n=2 Tax=Pseudonocardiaceae TaxID=2070 RepID=A0A2V4AD42_9PSEU|nr:MULTISPECIES: DUF6114 domain-containing protein [Pseudonocardiaceae]OLZ51819.1 hypothetical protein BS330_24490 [Amycolatopsis keratiniphila subsp. nogabecina]PXY16951.1 hypothetical protein BAY60_35115 [Prauserella muralis]TWE15008.1 hypothetical protein FHX69_7182 [Prauserella muralis]SDU62728.1 hypothetical protein SAMN04489733_7267 [Amycolatopsis keratiniphila]SFB64283.1 hypothetical protein SAMN05216266_1425 [Amycolatopsis marina]